MKVIATNTGFYLSLRQKGDEFELENENLFSSKWMKKVWSYCLKNIVTG